MARWLLLLVLMTPMVLGTSSCEQNLQEEYGIHVQRGPDGKPVLGPDGKPIITVDPKGGPIGSGVKLASDTASGFPGPGTLIGWGLSALFGAGGVVQQILLRRAQGEASVWKTAAHATAQGVQDFVSTLDSSHAQPTQPHATALADQLKELIDAHHDDHKVPQDIQNKLTPVT